MVCLVPVKQKGCRNSKKGLSAGIINGDKPFHNPTILPGAPWLSISNANAPLYAKRRLSGG